ncbi:MAG: gliding motility-associated C-terminal domain-containing protein [Saprospiraceae bacterium]|nr:gliding motility-associated C-terminal domain-containing protein [Saprospiraceae bacterium]
MTSIRQYIQTNTTLLGGGTLFCTTLKYVLAMGFIALLSQKNCAQPAVIRLDNCGVSYFDPQNANVSSTPQRDSMVFTEYFMEDSLLKAFYVDINAFGGQQVDRTKVFALMPDSSKLLLGELAFGNCTDCVEGFTLVENSVMQVQGVTTRQEMDMWLQGFAQPAFRLTNNLQTLRGVGRISGRIPFCAIGWQVEYSVFNTPNNSSTEFSTHILCTEAIANCPIITDATLDCQKDSLHLQAIIPSECFSNQASIRWDNKNGFTSDSQNPSLQLSGNLGMYYLQVEDAGCIREDSVLVENPPFTTAGEDMEVCQGESVKLTGNGGFGHFWEAPDGTLLNDSILNFANTLADQGGIYILHAFNDANCEDTDTLQLTVHVPPDPEVSFQAPCLGDSLILNILNDTLFSQIIWTHPRGMPLNPAIIEDFQVSDAGNYILIASDTFGCEIQKTVEINGNEPPELQFNIEESCDSSRVFFSPESFDYQWNDGSNGNRFSTAIGGIFQVTVTDPAGCSSVTEVELPHPDGPEIELEITQPFCSGDLGAIEIITDNPDRPIIFSIDGGATYSFEKRYKNLPYGKYLVIVQDDLGCISEHSVSIAKPDSMGVSLNLDSLEVRPGVPIRLKASTVGDIQLYQWLPKEIDSGNAVTEFEAVDNLNVRLIVEDARGCRASDGFFLRIVLGDIYAPNAFSPNNDGMNDRFTLFSDNGSGEIIESLQVFNRWGVQLFETKEIALNEEQLGWDGKYRGKPANPGVYVYQALVRFGNGTRKLYSGDVTLIR